jgi:lipopolysaccharide export system permease protein
MKWSEKMKQKCQSQTLKEKSQGLWKKLKMDKFIRKMDLYIIKKFLGTYFFAIALIITIAVVFDVNEQIDKFVTNKAPVEAIIFDYYMNFIPYFSNLFSPLFVFIAVIFFTSKMAENSEIIAMMSTGMSFRRMLRPYMISAAIIAALTYGLGAYVIPKGNVTRLDFESKYKRKKKVEYVRNVQLEVDSGVIAYMERYENYNKTAYRFSLDKFEDKKLVSHLTARSATYDTTSVHKWTLKNYMIREMDGMRENIIKGDRLDTIIKMEPQDFLITKGMQQTMTSTELDEYIAKQKRRGFANIKEFQIEYHQRIAMSFAAFILTIIGVSLSSRKVKGGMGLYLGIGLALSFSYILFQTISATFAVNGNTPPVLAVWIPNILYTFIAKRQISVWKEKGLRFTIKLRPIGTAATSTSF